MHALVAYDISDDRRRAAVSEMLGGFGPRVQLSVFEIQYDGPAELAALLRRIESTIDSDNDQVRCYELGHRLEGRRTIIGDRRLEEHISYVIM